MNRTDIALLRSVAHHCDSVVGLAIFSKGRRSVSETSLHRLTKVGLVEVETHNVSAWNFGPPAPPYNYAYQHGREAYQEEVARIDALRETLPKRTMQSRSEIWVKLTSLGEKFLADLPD